LCGTAASGTAARRANAKQSNAEIFSRIYRDKSWGGKELDFFSGNIPEVINTYVTGVRKLLTTMPPSVIVDIGCGDFMAGSQLTDLARSYIACDVVPELIEHNRRLFVRDNLSFIVMDAAKDSLPTGDIVIVKQVLQHLRNDQIAAIVRKLSQYRTWIISEHIPIGSFTPNLEMLTGESVRINIHSGVVLTEPPFSVEPSHTELLSEVEAHAGLIRTVAYKF
jgi:hypothetical protein